jgi:hypothetical protein
MLTSAFAIRQTVWFQISSRLQEKSRMNSDHAESRGDKQGLHSAARPLIRGALWNLLVIIWLSAVLLLFLGIRILGSATASRLFHRFMAR